MTELPLPTQLTPGAERPVDVRVPERGERRVSPHWEAVTMAAHGEVAEWLKAAPC